MDKRYDAVIVGTGAAGLYAALNFPESVSVLLQTNVAKIGNRLGQKWRVFKRAPIHDAFRIKPGQLSPELKIFLNWPKGCWLESKITTRFWIVTILMAALAIVTLKIR